jgi:D-threo-aldose 1-dehydrogenase
MNRTRLGRTSLEVSPIGYGGGMLGDPYGAIDEEQAQGALAAAWEAGISLYD